MKNENKNVTKKRAFMIDNINGDDKLNGDIVNYLSAAALCVEKHPAIGSSNKHTSRPLEVPK